MDLDEKRSHREAEGLSQLKLGECRFCGRCRSLGYACCPNCGRLFPENRRAGG